MMQSSEGWMGSLGSVLDVIVQRCSLVYVAPKVDKFVNKFQLIIDYSYDFKKPNM